MNKVMFTMYDSYNTIFNPLQTFDLIFQYVKVTNWKNRMLLASMPACFQICLFLYFNQYYLLSALSIVIGYILFELFETYLKHDIIHSNSIHHFVKDYDEEVTLWLTVLEKKLQLSMRDLTNVLTLEEIVRNEIENTSRKKTFGSRISTSIQTYLFPLLTFLGGMLLSRSITLEYLDVAILGVIMFALFLVIINILAHTLFDFSSQTKLRDILSLLLEQKLNIVASRHEGIVQKS